MPRLKKTLAVAIIAASSVLTLTAQASHTVGLPTRKKHTLATAKKIQVHSYGARQRMHNRAVLLAKGKDNKRFDFTVVEGDERNKAAQRAQNRVDIEKHPEWFSSPYRNLQDGTGIVGNTHLQSVTEQVIFRLQQQLGKPYVWGGETPQEGFDCSGLVFFAYNQVLSAKLPRTANEMYHYRRAIDVADNDLQRGDLLFFHISTRNKADHVGVYLGEGRFIESPRTGKNIRISDLSEEFWQSHFLGSKRILTENTVL